MSKHRPKREWLIYHLSNDEIYCTYLNHLFLLSEKYVIIYSNNTEIYNFGVNERPEYIRFRKLIDAIPNVNPINISLPYTTSFADFYVFQKIRKMKKLLNISTRST